MFKTDNRIDVLIIGGGLVGGPLACILAEQSLKVVLVDRDEPNKKLSPLFDGRASAIALSSQRVLDKSLLWKDIEPYACPIEQIRVSDGHSPLYLHYDHDTVSEDAFGWIIENRAMRASLFNRYKQLPSLKIISNCSVETLNRTNSYTEALLSNGEIFKASLIVAADGRQSPIRNRAKIQVTQWDYHQTAIVCTISHSLPHHNTAQEHFLPRGPFAILPLTNNRSSIVWTEKSSVAKAIISQNDADFLRELSHQIGNLLGDICLEGPRFSYPLSLQFADRYYDDRLAIIGDAAHGMHPVAGQGLNMGLRDVAALSELILESFRIGMDIGDSLLLERYGRWRRFDNMLMLSITDGLVRLFSNNFLPIQEARRLGMTMVEHAPPLKRFFIRHAMGLVGKLPKLMKG